MGGVPAQRFNMFTDKLVWMKWVKVGSLGITSQDDIGPPQVRLLEALKIFEVIWAHWSGVRSNLRASYQVRAGKRKDGGESVPCDLLSCSCLSAICTGSPFREQAGKMVTCLSFCPQVNEHLRDILVEEQKLRVTFQEANSTAQKVRHKHKQGNREWVCSGTMIVSHFSSSFKLFPHISWLILQPRNYRFGISLSLLLPKKRGHVLDVC